MQNINWEKITAYVVILGTIYMFWQSQLSAKSELSDAKERVRACEVKIDKLEEKK